MTARRRLQHWFLYSLRGISITDSDPDLGHPLFGDATIVSIGHLKRPTQAEDARTFASRVLHHIEPYHAFVGVRRYLVNRHDNNELTSAAQATLERALTVTAAVAFAMYLRSKAPCTLAEFHYQAGSSYILTDRQIRAVMSVNEARGLVIGGRTTPAKLAREDLKRLLTTPPADALTLVLGSPRPSIHNSLVAAARSAARSLCLAKHISIPSYRLLGCVTAMELLVTEHQTNYRRIEARVRALIGPAIADTYGIGAIFKTRHDFVHNGIEPPDVFGAWPAESAALHCLLRFSQAAPRFKHKRELLQYLDVLAAADNFAPHMSSTQGDAASKLLRHSRDRLKLKVLY